MLWAGKASTKLLVIRSLPIVIMGVIFVIGSIVSGSLMLMAESHGRLGAREASPNGPTTMPTSMKPSTELTRRRWNSGMTTAAAPRTMSVAL